MDSVPKASRDLINYVKINKEYKSSANRLKKSCIWKSIEMKLLEIQKMP